MTAPRDLLAALLDACRHGEVTRRDASRLLGIGKQDLCDLVAWRMVEAGIWRVYVEAFNRQFPECNPRLYQVGVPIPHNHTARAPMPSECRQYTAGEMECLLPSQPRLDEPLSNAAREFAEPAKRHAWDNSGMDLDRPPASDPRELAA